MKKSCLIISILSVFFIFGCSNDGNSGSSRDLCSIHYTDGIVFNTSSKTIPRGEILSEDFLDPLTPPSNFDGEFLGWCLLENENTHTLVKPGEITVNEDIELVSIWCAENKFTFVSEYGKTPEPKTCKQYYDHMIPANWFHSFNTKDIPVLEGDLVTSKYFVNWYYDQEFTKPFFDEVSIDTINYPESKNVTLYAKWGDGIKVTIIDPKDYHGTNDVTLVFPEKTYISHTIYGEIETIKISEWWNRYTVPKKNGYLANGFYKEDPLFNPANYIRNITEDLNGKKLYLDYEPKITLEFDANSGNYHDYSSIYQTSGAYIEYCYDWEGPDNSLEQIWFFLSDEKGQIVGTGGTKAHVPTKKGFIFTGWYKDPACSGDRFSLFPTVNEPTTIKLYAGWAKPTEVSFYVVDDKNTTLATTVQVLGDYYLKIQNDPNDYYSLQVYDKYYSDDKTLSFVTPISIKKSFYGSVPFIGVYEDPECTQEVVSENKANPYKVSQSFYIKIK